MPTNAEKAIEVWKQHIGEEDGVSDWMVIDQDRINAFADATLDHQFIHVDPEQSAQLSPYKVTIAHGFLTVSLLTHLSGQINPAYAAEAYSGAIMGINYGLDKVRFPSPVKVNSKIRARRELAEAELKGPNSVQVKYKITVEIEGEEKPCCVAEWLFRVNYG